MNLKNIVRAILAGIAFGLAISGLWSIIIIPALLLVYSFAKPCGIPVVE